MSDTAQDVLRLQAEAEAKMAAIRRKLVGEFIPALADRIRVEMEREAGECPRCGSCGGFACYECTPTEEPTNG